MNWKRTSRSYNFNEAFVLGETIPKEKHEETIRERSESLSSVEDDGPVANPRGLPTKAASIDFGVDDDVDDGKPLRNCFMGCFVVFVVLAMMTCVGILLYFILINTVFVDSDSRTLTGPLTVEGSLLLNETYHPDLADPESTAYKEMENKFTSAMSGSFGNSSLAAIYDRTRVERFEQGSIRIVFTVFLSSAPNDAASEMEVIVDVQVTVGNGISSGFFDAFDILEDSLEFTSVNQESQTMTTVRPPTTAFVESTSETTANSAIHSVTSQVILSLSTLFSTPITSVGTVAPTTIPITTRSFPPQAPTIPTTKVITMSSQSITSSPPPSTSEVAATTSSTMIDDTTGTDHQTAQLTTVPSFPTDSQTVGTTLANVSSVSPTNVHNSTIPPSTVESDSPLNSTVATTTHRGVSYAMYADDTQIYVSMASDQKTYAVNLLSDCLKDIKVWSAKNRLRLNEAKSELVHLSSQFRATEPLPDFNMGEGILKMSDSVKDLGVTLDKHLTLQPHIRNICKSASWGLFRIGKVRRLLDQASTEKLIHAFVSSHLDYCNSLFAGLPISSISPSSESSTLQREW
nr:mucin-3A-like [Lytechinus pictus]